MKFIYNKKILITILITIVCIMIFNVKVFAENTDTEGVFSLEQESLDVYLNGKGYLSYTGKDSTQDVTWTSSDTTIATVENGIVTGLKLGKTTITATNGTQTDSCEINVVYYDIQIGANRGDYISTVSLVLGEHETENLYANVEDGKYEKVSDAQIEWTSSDSSIVTVGKDTGVLKAIKTGTATITATAAGVTDTCEVTVYAAPEFTDFSNADYELLFDIDVDLKITGVTPDDENSYYYIVTSNNTKPEISTTSWGALDTDVVAEANYLIVNTEENYIYARNLDKYVELNQDLYLWVIQKVSLDGGYVAENQNNIYYSTKFVVEAEKLTRPELPQLNLILKGFSVYGWEDDSNLEKNTWIRFRFPSATENRKFTIKIGKVTDYDILKKIQNNDYSGITDLLSYAKNNQSVYTTNLTTTRENYYRSEQVLFDGNALLTDDAYYFIYVIFDDEDGKYYPIEGVTLGQAYLSEISDVWQLWAYTSEDFEWNNLTPTYTPTETPTTEDTTIAPTIIPNAGSKAIIAVIMLIIISSGIVFYKKCNKLRDIR